MGKLTINKDWYNLIFIQILLTLLSVFESDPVFSQITDQVIYKKIDNDNIQFDRLGQVKGLEKRSITSIIQDNQGFLWLGTLNGLIRYDGYELKQYSSNLKNKNSLSNDDIRG